MVAVREEFEGEVGERTLRREAFMRQTIRKARKETDGPIVVVCGAWHVPALLTKPTVAADTALLKGLRRRKISGTWVPWSHGQLAAESGYGAGVDSPGWYAHLWQHQVRRRPALVRQSRGGAPRGRPPGLDGERGGSRSSRGNPCRTA